MRALIYIALASAGISVASSTEIEGSLKDAVNRLSEGDYLDSLAGLAENFPIYREWDDLKTLRSNIVSDVSGAARIALDDNTRIEQRAIVVYVASDLPPSSFFDFWDMFSRESSLSPDEKRLVEYGLLLQGGSNLRTLSFNRSEPHILAMLARLRELVEGNHRASMMLEGIESGKLKEVQIRELREYGSRDWESSIPDLGEDALEDASEEKIQIESKNTANVESTSVLEKPSPLRSVRPYVLVAVAVVGIVIVLVRSRKRKTGR